MNSLAPSPFTCSQYPTQSKEVMLYRTYTSTYKLTHSNNYGFGCKTRHTSSKMIIYSSFRAIYISSLISLSVKQLVAPAEKQQCKRSQGRNALNGESAACSQVLWESKGHSRPKVTEVQGLNYIMNVLLHSVLFLL